VQLPATEVIAQPSFPLHHTPITQPQNPIFIPEDIPIVKFPQHIEPPPLLSQPIQQTIPIFQSPQVSPSGPIIQTNGNKSPSCKLNSQLQQTGLSMNPVNSATPLSPIIHIIEDIVIPASPVSQKSPNVSNVHSLESPQALMQTIPSSPLPISTSPIKQPTFTAAATKPQQQQQWTTQASVSQFEIPLSPQCVHHFDTLRNPVIVQQTLQQQSTQMQPTLISVQLPLSPNLQHVADTLAKHVGIHDTPPEIIKEADNRLIRPFLEKLQLLKYLDVFNKEEVFDIPTLKLLQESDFKQMGIPIGPTRRIIAELLKYN